MSHETGSERPGRRAGRPPGRRPGKPETRQQILDAARALFAERGFTGTSMRAVAAAAEVDVALVPHYFGNKEGLFRAVLEIPVDPDDVVAAVVSGDRDGAPQRLVEAFLQVWESPETGPAMLSVLRRAVADQGSAETLRDFFGAAVLRQVAGTLLADLPAAEAQTRMALAASQMFGLVLLRRVIGLEPLARLSTDQVAAAVTPTIARYLLGDLRLPHPDDTEPPHPAPKEQP